MSRQKGDWVFHSGEFCVSEYSKNGDVYSDAGKSENGVEISTVDVISNKWRVSVSSVFGSVVVLIVGFVTYFMYTVTADSWLLYIAILLSLTYFALKFSIAYYLAKDVELVAHHLNELDSPVLDKIGDVWSPDPVKWGVAAFFSPPVTELGVLSVYLMRRKKATGQP
jgi:hypothetical protein